MDDILEMVKSSVTKTWESFITAIWNQSGDPFSYWVPEVREIQVNCFDWWRANTSAGEKYIVTDLNIFSSKNQGTFKVKSKRGILELGFKSKGDQTYLFPAKSLKLMSQLSSWKLEESEHFRFYHTCDTDLPSSLISKCENIYKILQKQLHRPLHSDVVRKEKVGYVLCNDQLQLSNLIGIFLDESSSVTDPVSLTIISTRLADAHEIAHAVISKFIGGAPPIAYREGFAECFSRPLGWQEFISNPFRQPSVFSDLSLPGFYRAPAPWAQSGGFCKYILLKFGIDLMIDAHRDTNRYNFKEYFLERTGKPIGHLMTGMRNMALEDPYQLESCELI